MKTKTKNTNILVRVNSEENNLFDIKANLLGITKSQLLRDSAFWYWKGKNNQKWSEQLLTLYKDGNNETKQFIVNIIFEYYRRKGYPHNKLNKKQLTNEMAKIVKTKSPLLGEDHLQINAVGTILPNHFHPHMMKVFCRKNYLSPYALFKDDEKFKDAINRVMELGKRPNHAGIRKILRTRDGVRSVVNFKPVISKYIYETYVPQNGTVLDPCAGYGGRLTGLIATRKNLTYHGIDPCPETVIGNAQLAGHFSKLYDVLTNEKAWPFNYSFDMGCAEDVMPKLNSGSYDLIFTSPPYFDIEKYDTLPNQSYLKFPTYSDWIEGFLKVILLESIRVCKHGGHIIYNVKNSGKFKLADDLVKIMESQNLKLKKTYHMRLTNNEFHLKEGNTFHTEPIFVWEK